MKPLRQYAKVVWNAADVQTLRPGWNFKKSEDWLRQNEKYIRDRLIELGWDVIEALLPPEEERSCATCCHNNKGCCNYDGDCDCITYPKWNRNCGDKND